MRSLRYLGPSLDTLHEQYAKRGRIDDRAAVRAHWTVEIDAPTDTVWAVLATPAGWSRVDPAIRDVTVHGPVAPDTRFSWTNGSAKISSRFAVVRPEEELTWTGVSSGARAVHRHILRRRPGGTHLEIQESMAGPLLGLFFGAAKLQAAVEAWATAVKRAAEDTQPDAGR